MKKLIIAIFGFSTVILFSQTYHFKYSLDSNRYDSGKNIPWNAGMLFFDTSNNAQMSFLNHFGETKAIINDPAKQMTHVYLVKESVGQTKFIYSNSSPYSPSFDDIENPYFITVEQIDSSNFQVDVFIYTNKKKTKKDKKVSAIITLEKSDFEYFQIPMDFFPVEYIKTQILSKLPKENKYYISKIDAKFVGGSKSTTINTVKNIDLTFTIPNK